MAVSLAWGVLFSTFITLLLVPCLYLMAEDFTTGLSKLLKPLANDQEETIGRAAERT